MRLSVRRVSPYRDAVDRSSTSECLHSSLRVSDVLEDDECECVVVLNASLDVDALDAPESAHLVVDHTLRHLTRGA